MTYMLAVWRCWSPQKRDSMEMSQGGQAGLGKHVTAGVKRGLLASSPSSPHFTHSILSRRSDDSLIAECWMGTNNATQPSAVEHLWALAWECLWLLPDLTSLQDCWIGSQIGHTLCIWHRGNPPYLEGDTGGTDSGTECVNNFSACHKDDLNSSWDRTSCKPMTWHWFWSTCAMTGQRRGIIMASWNLIIILLSGTSQQQSCIILLWEGGDCVAARSPWCRKLPSGTQHEDFSQ
jgi:hypothetical protein